MVREHQHQLSADVYADEREYGAKVTRKGQVIDDETIHITDHEIERLAKLRGIV